MTSSPVALSLIIPVYNAAPFIMQTVEEIVRTLSDDTEMILVNDGSLDATPEALRDIQKKYPAVRVIQLKKNMGKGFAIKAGLREAHGEYIAFTDADLPYGTAVLGQMRSVLVGNPSIGLVYGSRSHAGSKEQRGYGIIRKCGRLFFSLVVRGLVAPTVSDTQCGVKMLRRSFADRVLAVSEIDRFAFDVELFAIAEARGIATSGIPVFLNHRKESSVRLVGDTVGMLRDIWRIRGNMRHGIYKQ